MSDTPRPRKTYRLDERESYVKVHLDISEDFSDGAFMGYMAEKGIDLEEAVAVSQKCYGEPEDV